MALEIKKAVRSIAKLRLGLTGPSGSGKTYGALLIAKGIASRLKDGKGRIALIDSERGSASLYSDIVDFDTIILDQPYSPERYIEAMEMVEKAGYDICVVDSTTHEWNGSGGCLEINEVLANARYKGNTWSAWNETTPRHRAFLDKINQTSLHLIATMRSKMETVQEGGKVKKLGMKSEQRDGTEYEFTTILELSHDGHYAVPGKDRTNLFKEPFVITESTGRVLVQWLNAGAVLKVDDKPNAFIVHRDAIMASKTMDELKTAFLAASQDKAKLTVIEIADLTSIKDKRKTELSSTVQDVTTAPNE